jgi:hypothetical protein
MKQEMRRTRKASEVRPALDEMANFTGRSPTPRLLDVPMNCMKLGGDGKA